MKRFIYVLAVLFALGAASCSKQDVRPNSNGGEPIPTWRGSMDDGPGCDDDDNGNGGIVDPGVDPDANK